MTLQSRKDPDSIVLSNEDFFCKSLDIGLSVDAIMAEFNAFDWLDLKYTPAEELFENFKERLKFDNPKNKYWSIREKAFAYKFERALLNLSALVEEVNDSYNIPGANGVTNEVIMQYYYIKYWADKKCIAVDYNEHDYNKRKLFNFYTILFNIFATKLENFNLHNKK
jgi:hypothetical protein